jgi:hypothetical protein
MAEMAGYSGTPLLRKLGIKAGMRIVLLHAPANLAELLGELPEGIKRLSSPRAPVDFAMAFVMTTPDLNAALTVIQPALGPAGMIWLCWPKKASGVPSEVGEESVRRAGLGAGLVDIKVCAVDETWSGLKFVIPVADRATTATRIVRN